MQGNMINDYPDFGRFSLKCTLKDQSFKRSFETYYFAQSFVSESAIIVSKIKIDLLSKI